MTQNERIIMPIWKKTIIVIITLITFAIQIALFVMAFQFEFTTKYHVAVYYVIEILAIALVFHIIHKPILTNYKLTWSILILALPLPSMLLYLLNHSSKKALPKRKQRIIDEFLETHQISTNVISEVSKEHPQAAKLAKVLNSSSKYPLYNNTKYTFLNDGEVKFKDFINEVKKAQKYIFIETFIISEGVLIDELLPVLRQKGNEGVEIKILYDDLGSKRFLKTRTIKELTSIPNCEITNYNPLGLNINPIFNYRDHRKIIIIDGRIAYCGGDNFADEYIHQKDRFGYWRDNCGKYEGEAVRSFIVLFSEMWYMSTKKDLEIKKYISDIKVENNESYILPFGDGPSNQSEPGYDIFNALISTANTTLYISTPYLIVDDGIIENIMLAARSGVDVRILMPGIPDKKTAFYLAKSNYGRLLDAGVKIYEFTPGFNHAKNIMVDGKFAFIGTMNFDYRSLFLHYECGALILLDKEIKEMEKDFIDACDNSHLVTHDEWKKRPWWQKFISYLLQIISPMF